MSGCLHTFTRRGYYGGRVEPYRALFDGPGVLNYGDVNSMYPWAMLGPVPTELAFTSDGGSVAKVHHNAKKYLGFVECRVTIPTDCYLPPLPWRHDNKLLFPVGTLGGVWTTEELALLARIGGSITDVYRSVWFRGQEVFGDYVNHWYRHRDKTLKGYNLALDMVAKLFLNSLYGKMGMNSEREKIWFFPTDAELEEHSLTPMVGAIFGGFIEQMISEPPYVIPHIAAWVTARSRARLWSLMQDMLDLGYRIYYCDTDSIVTDAPIKDSSALGDLKTVCQIKRAQFVAPKMYFIEKVKEDKDGMTFVKAKGFNGGFGAEKLSEAQFNAIVKHHEKVKLSRMRKLREGVKSGERFPAMKVTMKGIKATVLNNKRNVGEDGNSTAKVVIDGIPY